MVQQLQVELLIFFLETVLFTQLALGPLTALFTRQAADNGLAS
jgi:hypothetical protein